MSVVGGDLTDEFGNDLTDELGNRLQVSTEVSASSYFPLQTILPCYPYQQYSDDPNIYAFFNAVNELAQPYLDYFNQTPFAVYTNASINGPLLDWIGQGIYGISRPVFSTEGIQFYGGVNVFAMNTVAVNGDKVTRIGNAVVANDDFYKRVLTWWLYAGNGGNGGAVGRYFNAEVLRLKVARFLYGVNGTDVTLSQAQAVSVQPQNVAPPPVPTITTRSGGSLTAHFYGVYVTYVTPIGETNGSPLGVMRASANQLITVASPPAENGATGYNVYANYQTTNTNVKENAVNRYPMNVAPVNGNNTIPATPQTKQNATPIPIGTAWLEPPSGLIVGAPLPVSNTSNTPGNFLITIPPGTAATYFTEALEQGVLAFPFVYTATVIT